MQRVFVVLAIVGLGWCALAPPRAWADDAPSVAPADLPPPATVAAWLLEGDDAQRDRAVELLRTGPRDYAREVVDALRHRGRDDRLERIDRWIDRAVAAQGAERTAAVRRLLDFGEDAVRALLARLPGASELVLAPEDVEAAPPPPPEEAAEGPLVRIETRLLQVDGGRLRDVLGDRLGPDQPASLQLEAADVLALLGADRNGGPGVQVLAAPQLVTYEGQRANLSILNQVSYVQDYEVETGGFGQHVADPVIGTLQEGLVLDVTPTTAENGKGIALGLEASWAEVHRPIPEFETSLFGQKVKIQLPEMEVRRIRHPCTATPGSWLLLGGLGEGSGGVRLLLVRATLVEAGALDAPEAEAPRGTVTPR